MSADVFLLAQSGDPIALAKLLDTVSPDLRRYARRQCHRASFVEDVVQEALIIVYRKVGHVHSPAALGGGSGGSSTVSACCPC